MKALNDRRVYVSSGFTLVEMLVAVALVAIVAGLVLAGVGKMKRSSQSVTCASNLRQVGLAMTQYTQENDNTLPGPLWRGQSPYYQTGNAGGGEDRGDGNLVSFLAGYLQLEPTAAGGMVLAKSVSCPAWRAEEEKKGKSICYFSTGLYVLADGEEVLPFGKMAEDEADEIAPLRMVALGNPAEIPALREFDRRGLTEGFYSLDPRVPEGPVHETVRHVLYFDGHVAAESVN